MPYAALRELTWLAAIGDATGDTVAVSGADPVLPTPYRVGTAAARAECQTVAAYVISGAGRRVVRNAAALGTVSGAATTRRPGRRAPEAPPYATPLSVSSPAR